MTEGAHQRRRQRQGGQPGDDDGDRHGRAQRAVEPEVGQALGAEADGDGCGRRRQHRGQDRDGGCECAGTEVFVDVGLGVVCRAQFFGVARDQQQAVVGADAENHDHAEGLVHRRDLHAGGGEQMTDGSQALAEGVALGDECDRQQRKRRQPDNTNDLMCSHYLCFGFVLVQEIQQKQTKITKGAAPNSAFVPFVLFC